MSGSTEVARFLADASAATKTDAETLLALVLNLSGPDSDPRFARLFAVASDATRRLIVEVDRCINLLNPGLHYVWRSGFLGYRRREGARDQRTSERSGVFLSIVPRRNVVRVLLPVEPSQYAGRLGCVEIGPRGHAGVGTVVVELADGNNVSKFLVEFDDWLRPASP